MNDLNQVLLTEWIGTPLVIWLSGLLFLILAISRKRGFRFKFKTRRIEIIFESDAQINPTQITSAPHTNNVNSKQDNITATC
jgi:hypothetical protein